MVRFNNFNISDPQLRMVLNADGSHSLTVQAESPISGDARYDAFNRFRSSSPNTLFDSKQLYDNAPLFWDDAQLSGSGTDSSHSVNQAATTLSVSASTAGRRARQTKRRFNYQPGKSQLILMTGVMGAAADGITRRIGYFDGNNGLFFQLYGSTLSVARRTKVTGNVVDVSVNQADWNLDKLDGTGISGITLDTSKAQIFVIDFEWLGVGSARFGFVINGMIIYCHEMLNANVLSTVYMSTPNLPLRYEIANDGSGEAATLVHICTTVISEGGQEQIGVVLSASNGNVHVDANAAGTIYACLGLRLKSTHLSASIINLFMTMMGVTATDNFHWQLLLNPTVAGTFAFNDITNSACQLATGATANTISGGTLINSGYGAGQTSETEPIINALSLGSTIAGVSDRIVLAVMPLGTATPNLDIYASLTWRELL